MSEDSQNCPEPPAGDDELERSGRAEADSGACGASAAIDVQGDAASPTWGHEPVLAQRVLELLTPALEPRGLLLDATLGMGGHAELVLSRVPGSCVVGLDRDPEALAVARQRLAPFGERFRAFQAVFDTFSAVLAGTALGDPNAFLFDLGVSSLQLDSDARGFAYARETPLDMRMDPSGPVTAADIVNGYGVEELARVLTEYGEERFARRIAARIVQQRTTAPIVTSAGLSEIVTAAVPAAARRRGHPAKRVFQALRIEVNDELGTLRRALDAAVRRLPVGGRIVVLSYHSLEDRIVKRTFASGTQPDVPPDLPVVPADAQPFLRSLTRGAEQAGAAEIARNPRAASVRLRAVSATGAVPSGWRAA